MLKKSLLTPPFMVALILVLLALPLKSYCADKTPGPQPLDGVNIEALETYQNPKPNQIQVGLSVWPVDPYYNGFGLDLGYRHFYNKTNSWQIVDLDYLYTVDKGLTSQLAENYGVAPQKIERINFIVSSNWSYVMAYGKFIFMSKHIRYFRSAFLAGPAYIASNKESSIGLNLGWQFEVFANGEFSWDVQIRDVYSPNNVGNNLALVLGTAYGL